MVFFSEAQICIDLLTVVLIVIKFVPLTESFDSHPLAPDVAFTLQDSLENFKAGMDVLKKLTDYRKSLICQKKGGININIVL